MLKKYPNIFWNPKLHNREWSEVFTTVTMKNSVFWDVAPCRSCVNRRFGGTYRPHLQGRLQQSAANCSRWFFARGFFYPEDGGYALLRNFAWHMVYTAPHPRRQHSSFITVFIRALYRFLSWTRSIQFILLQSIFLRSILIFPSRLRRGSS
jgi:hypothetical protein